MLGTSKIPGDLVDALSERFCVTKEDGGPMSAEKRSGREVHSLLDHLASGVDPVLGFEQVDLLQVDPDGTIHLLHPMFSVPVDPYSTARRIFA